MLRKHAHQSSGPNINNNNNSHQLKKFSPSKASSPACPPNRQATPATLPSTKRKRSEDPAEDLERIGPKKPRDGADDDDPTTKKLQETEEALRSLSGAGLLLQSSRNDPVDTPFVNLFEKEAHAEKPPSAVASAWKDVVSVSSCSSNGSAPSPALHIVTSPRVADLTCVKQEPPSTPQAAAVSSRPRAPIEQSIWFEVSSMTF